MILPSVIQSQTIPWYVAGCRNAQVVALVSRVDPPRLSDLVILSYDSEDRELHIAKSGVDRTCPFFFTFDIKTGANISS
jgi:hypothetical protein